MSGQIFISYRRDDSPGSTGRLCDRLIARFGRNNIFMDVDSLPPGVDFAKAIRNSVESCDVLISVIGKRWLTSSDEKRRRRLDNRDDFVRTEITAALKRDIRVIPVLVEDASMPRPRDLPDDLKPLANRNAIVVRHDSFGRDSERLIAAVEQVLELTMAERREEGQNKRPEHELQSPPARPVALSTSPGKPEATKSPAETPNPLKENLSGKERELTPVSQTPPSISAVAPFSPPARPSKRRLVGGAIVAGGIILTLFGLCLLAFLVQRSNYDQAKREQTQKEVRNNFSSYLFEKGVLELSQGRPLEAETLFAESTKYNKRRETLERLIEARASGARFVFLAKPNDRLFGEDGPGPHILGLASDGETALIGETDGPVRLWDTRKQKFLAETPTHIGKTHLAVISGDRTWVAWDRSTSTEGNVSVFTLFLWNSKTGEELRFDAGDRPIASIAFSPTQPLLAFASERGVIHLWNLQLQRERAPLLGNNYPVWSLAFSRNGRWIVSGGTAQETRLWDLTTGKSFPLTGHNDWVTSVAFSPNNDILASASADATVRLWDLANPGKSLAILSGHVGAVFSVAFSPDGRLLASGGEDQFVRLWDVSDVTAARSILEVKSYEGQVHEVAFSTDGRDVLACGPANWIRRWGIAIRTEVSELSNFGSPTTSVAFLPDGKSMAVTSYDGKVRLWDLDAGAVRTTIDGSGKKIVCIAANQKRPLLAWGGEDNALHIWDLNSGHDFHSPIEFHDAKLGDRDNGEIWDVAFSHDGSKVACASYNRTIHVYDLASLTQPAVLFQTDEGAAYALSFNKTDDLLASGGGDRCVRLWDLKTFTSSHIFKDHTGEVLGVAFSPDGTRIASGATDRTVRIWDTRNVLKFPPLAGHDGSISSVAFNPVGRWLASCSVDQTVRLWDAKAWMADPQNIDPEDVFILRKAKGALEWVEFSPDGRKLACCDLAGFIYVWNVGVIESVLLETPVNLVSQATRDTGLRVNGATISPAVQ
jgi:WD40 repeat protein